MAAATRAAPIHRRCFGRGDPVIALHPLALDGSAFAGLGKALAARGFRTIAVDLPGFGATPRPDAPLTPAVLAAPVVELARRMRTRPLLLGVSMGGRVALEAALAAPEAFRGVVVAAPYLPWRRLRWAFPLARLASPRAVEALPLEIARPVLRWLAELGVRLPLVRDDAFARAGARALYQASWPATRRSIVSAAREMALDPAFGPAGFWTRLPSLAVPAAFLWGGRDRLVPQAFARPVAKALPGARQIVLPCLGHGLAGPHQRCFVDAVASLLATTGRARSTPAGPARVSFRAPRSSCRVEDRP